ncbi:hypothetical protein PR048_016168 [Dryococelus australis]|uniref:Integrase catalytic domain-containing protein n=1 Tax=Dryococelus australis TaxID=614101 RepID=A0ABQ9HIZ5_9NEOP|nr:hypothetical protein PR048_016168 [Dryococelus australis]
MRLVAPLAAKHAPRPDCDTSHCKIIGNEASSRNAAEPFIPHAIPELLFEKVGVDLCDYGGNSYMVVVDYYSKWIELVLVENKERSEICDCHSRHAKTFVSDNMLFSSHKYKPFARQWDFEIVKNLCYPKSNGQAEQAVQNAKNMLNRCTDPGSDLPIMLLKYRNTPLAGLGLSPAQLLMSQRVRTKLRTVAKLLEPYVPKKVAEVLLSKEAKSKHWYDQRTREKKELPLQTNGLQVQRNSQNFRPSSLAPEEHGRRAASLASDFKGLPAEEAAEKSSLNFDFKGFLVKEGAESVSEESVETIAQETSLENKEASSKWKEHVKLPVLTSPEGDASSQPGQAPPQPAHKWPLRPGVLVHVNGTHSLSLRGLPQPSGEGMPHSSTPTHRTTGRRGKKMKRRRAVSMGTLASPDETNQHSRANRIRQMFSNDYRGDTLPGIIHSKSEDLNPSATKGKSKPDLMPSPNDGLLQPDGDKTFYENLPFHGMQTAPNKLWPHLAMAFHHLGILGIILVGRQEFVTPVELVPSAEKPLHSLVEERPSLFNWLKRALSLMALPRFGLPIGGGEESCPLNARRPRLMRPVARPETQTWHVRTSSSPLPQSVWSGRGSIHTPSAFPGHNRSRLPLTTRPVIESGNLSRPPPAYGVNHYQHESNPMIGHQREPHGGAN